MFGWEPFHDLLGGWVHCDDVTGVEVSEAGAELIRLLTTAAAVMATEAMPVLGGGGANVVVHIVVFVSENVISFISEHSKSLF